MRHRTPSAADYLGISRRTLEKWRTAGGGPRFAKLGGVVVYDERDLEGVRARASPHQHERGTEARARGLVRACARRPVVRDAARRGDEMGCAEPTPTQAARHRARRRRRAIQRRPSRSPEGGAPSSRRSSRRSSRGSDAQQRKLEQKQRAQGIRPPSVCRLTPAALLSQPQPKLAPVGEPEAAEVGLGERDPRDPLDTLVSAGNYPVAMVDWERRSSSAA